MGRDSNERPDPTRHRNASIEYVELNCSQGCTPGRLRWKDGTLDGEPWVVEAFFEGVRRLVADGRPAPGPIPATYPPGWNTAHQFFATAGLVLEEMLPAFRFEAKLSAAAERALEDAAWVPPGAIP